MSETITVNTRVRVTQRGAPGEGQEATVKAITNDLYTLQFDRAPSVEPYPYTRQMLVIANGPADGRRGGYGEVQTMNPYRSRTRRALSFTTSRSCDTGKLLSGAIVCTLLGIVLAIGFFWARQGHGVWSNAREVTAVQFEDMPLGRPALLRGVLQAPAAPGQFAVFVTEYRSCSTDKDGNRSCSWYESSRWTPPDVQVDGITIENSDYLISGQLFEQRTFFGDARTRGIPPGATVLAAVQRSETGAWAREIYVGGTAAYRLGWGVLVWVLGIAAVVCLLFGAVSGYLWWTA